ncbi:MAG: hypothetical protein ACI3XR_03545 [Eubacteriales bacterium]
MTEGVEAGESPFPSVERYKEQFLGISREIGFNLFSAFLYEKKGSERLAQGKTPGFFP